MENLLVKLIKRDIRDKNNFSKITKIDLQNSKYEVFGNKKYSKKLYGNDLFLFFKNNRFIGATNGATYRKDLEYYSSMYGGDITRKNRVGLESLSNIIIRIPQEELIYKPRYNKKYNPYSIKTTSLKNRLIDYKNSKVKTVSKEEATSMIITLNNYVINNIDNQEKLDKFAKVSSWSTRPGHLLKEIGSLLDNYRSTLQSYEEYKEYCKNLIEENNFYEKRLLKSIVDIKAWHSIIK